MPWNAVGPDGFHLLKVPMLLGVILLNADTAAAVAIACSRLLRSMLFNLSAFDPLAFALALAGVCLVTLLLAAAVPARRASWRESDCCPRL